MTQDPKIPEEVVKPSADFDRPWRDPQPAGLFDRFVTLFFVQPLLMASHSRDRAPHLTPDDLFPLPDAHRSEALGAQLLEDLDGGATINRALFAVAKAQVVGAGIAQLGKVAAELALPVFVRLIVTSIEDQTFDGLYYACGLLCAALVGGWCNQTHLQLMDVAALRLRGACVTAMYGRALDVRTGQQRKSAAELVSVIATDTERFRDVAPVFHLLWASPLQVVLGAVILVLFFGWTALMGVAVLLLLYPFTILLGRTMRNVKAAGQPDVDRRTRLVSELVQGIRVIKMYGWERPLAALIGDVRSSELWHLSKELMVLTCMSVFLTVAQPIAGTATFAVETLVADRPLEAANTFAYMAMLSVLKFPVMFFGRAMMLASQLQVAVDRIGACLHSLEAGPAAQSGSEAVAAASGRDRGVAYGIEKGVFGWRSDAADDTFTLGPLDVELKAGAPVAVTGAVGAGKSMAILSLLGETARRSGRFIGTKLHGTSTEPFVDGAPAVSPLSVAYAAQEPFLLSGTVKANIFFELPPDDRCYQRTLDACQLREDLAAYPDGDQTVVGERGVTLSGGQKARIALARATYCVLAGRADVCLLDDPFSALDARTGRRVLTALLDKKTGCLRDTPVAFVTHSAHHARMASSVVHLDGDGTARALTLKQAVAAGAVAPHSGHHSDSDDDEEGEDVGKKKTTDELVTAEESETGTVALRTYGRYLLLGGVWWPVAIVGGMLLERTLYVGADVWLSIWTSAYRSAPTHGIVDGRGWPAADTHGSGIDSGSKFYLFVYGCVALVTLLMVLVRIVAFWVGGVVAARHVFEQAFAAVVRCPAAYFDTTPTGRILNRLTHDVDRMQFPLISQVQVLIGSLGWLVAGLVVTAASTPWTMLVTLPCACFVFLLLFFFRAINVHLMRADTVTRSNVQSFVFESLSGAVTVRSFGQQAAFRAECVRRVDHNVRAMYSFAVAQRWAGVRTDCLAALEVGVVGIICWALRSSLDPSVAGLAFVWSVSISRTFAFAVTDGVQGEAKFVSVERLMTYIDDLPEEPARSQPDDPARGDGVFSNDSFNAAEAMGRHHAVEWPVKGVVEFRDVKMRYRPTLPLVLDGCSFQVKPGTRVGVVGRTGSGKSSLIVALYRLREVEAGQVLVDGLDISGLGLDCLRGGRMCIIPQDPVVFSGTVRSNVDPFGECSDDDVLAALDAVQLRDHVVDRLGGIAAPVHDRGANFSVGQRQLLCIARAVLRRPAVLLMDEATANVDSQTDRVIRAAVRRLFAGSTVIEVAHRLHSVMDTDQIIVMGAGKVLESGTPKKLLADAKAGRNSGALAAMVKASGPAAAELEAMAVAGPTQGGEY